MKKILLLTACYLLLAFGFSSCFILGIHTKVQNPKHAGRYPKFSEGLKLLGNQDSKYRRCFDVTFYEINITVDEKKKYLKGEVEIVATALSDFDTLQIDLFENMRINKMRLSPIPSPKEEGSNFQELNYFRRHGAVFVRMPATMNKNKKFQIVIDYEGSPLVAKKPPWRGGFVWKKDKEGNPWIGVACETEGASLWWPCKDVTNDEPDSAAINITTKKNLVAVSNGKLVGIDAELVSVSNPDQQNVTYKWFVSYPINLYNITLYIGKFKLLQDSLQSKVSGKTLPFNHYVLETNYEKAKKHFRQTKEQIAFYEKTFGEYPWYKDGYKLVESPYEGMEHQSAIAYGNGYKTSYNGFDYIILHESAHEWWGNSVSSADLADVWIHEGFATYAEALFVESTQGKNAYLRYLLVYRLFIKNKRPVAGPPGVRFFDYKDTDVYMKGAWLLLTLRTLINNDEIFFSVLKSFYEKYKMKTVCSQDFIALVNEKTGEDYNWFFNQYLYKRQTPFLEYFWNGTEFFYRWKYTDDSFKMPVEILLDGQVKITLQPTTDVQKIEIDGKAYKEISFNNYTKLFGTISNKKLKVNRQ